MDQLATYWKLVSSPFIQTIQMVAFSTLFSVILGLPIGVLLYITDSEEKGGILPKPMLNAVLSRIILGTAIGTKATIIPLSIAAAPFVARVIESAIREVDPGVVQAAKAMGSTNWQIVYKVLIPEAMPSLVSGITLTIINLIGYSAMAGAIGGGGLGDLAIRYGYQRFRSDIMIITVVIIILLVEIIQLIGNKIAAKMISKR